MLAGKREEIFCRLDTPGVALPSPPALQAGLSHGGLSALGEVFLKHFVYFGRFVLHCYNTNV
jgi:hypothetical protein